MSTQFKAAYTLEELAEVTPWSVSTFRRALKATNPREFPPPLTAKRDSKGKQAILHTELQRWLESLPDA